MKRIVKQNYEKYISPEMEILQVTLQSRILDNSNESIGGGDNPDHPWTPTNP